jgi:hypothetical protein
MQHPVRNPLSSISNLGFFKMKLDKWLILSLLGFLAFLWLLISVDCNVFGMLGWRGNKAAYLALLSALLGVTSIISLMIRTLLFFQTPASKFGGILLLFTLVFFGVVATLIFSKAYCH